jgi:hypothetical protein
MIIVKHLQESSHKQRPPDVSHLYPERKGGQKPLMASQSHTKREERRDPM